MTGRGVAGLMVAGTDDGARLAWTLLELLRQEARADQAGREGVLARRLEVLPIVAFRAMMTPASPSLPACRLRLVEHIQRRVRATNQCPPIAVDCPRSLAFSFLSQCYLVSMGRLAFTTARQRRGARPRLAQTPGQTEAALREQAGTGDLTSSQMVVLVRLEKEDSAMTSGLARAEGMRPQPMGAVVAALLGAGLISGAPDRRTGVRRSCR